MSTVVVSSLQVTVSMEQLGPYCSEKFLVKLLSKGKILEVETSTYMHTACFNFKM